MYISQNGIPMHGHHIWIGVHIVKKQILYMHTMIDITNNTEVTIGVIFVERSKITQCKKKEASLNKVE